ncbi:L-lactate dehydrogenase (cytochrome) [Kaistia hirudinis]|uniref:L-lactate dehydrogenase (Cytochrome) n=2 Tax=Kaistia hirudinis TaxID=1293440 RepID=A0A840AIX3_9HYPH|nr:L-lactate dehydrogenase (cytochrome) [Kaistia hirudinis]
MMKPIASIDDLKAIARRRVPRMFYDYVDGGSWTEQTYRANSTDFDRIHLRQRVAVDVSDRDLTTTMIGQPVSMPVAIAPTGLTGMVHADGEICAARAAERFGVPFTLSTMSICSLEDVAAAVSTPIWFQLYVMRDRSFVAKLVERARVAGCAALVLTLDLQMVGQRHKDIHNGLSSPPKPTLRNLANLATKPRWCLGMLGTRRRSFGNLIGHVEGLNETVGLAKWTDSQFDPSLDWDDVRRIRDMWAGKLILKGILDPEDAVHAVDCGADAIIVSNHGGRQLDGALSSIAALPDIVAAVGGRTEVHLDGGIRSGQDVLKAVALGAKGVYIGRSMLYGLGALGEAGVTRSLEIIRKELFTTMGLCGVRSIAELGRDNLILRHPLD